MKIFSLIPLRKGSTRLKNKNFLKINDKPLYKYVTEQSLKSKFIESISQYWPEINSTKLHPDYTGIRPKITKPNEKMKDFSIQTSDHHGIKNFINLQGIESPGLTSSLAIGKLVKNLL